MYINKVMYGFEYIYQASRITKTAIILGVFIIIGLATRNWSGEIDPDKVQLEDEIAHKYTGPHIGKKLKLLVNSIILKLQVQII